VLPPISSRIDLQDTIYDGAARIHGRLAVDDPAGALAAARTVTPLTCHFVSPADVVSEVMTDPRELRAFVEALTARGEVLLSPRMAVVNGRLALAEGRIDEAIAYLSAADSDFRKSELMLDAWHVGRGLAEAEFRAGRESAAKNRLQRVIQDASSAGAYLAARLASLTAERLGLDVDAVGGQAPAAPAGYVATGERMVSVLFADVRGYTELSGEAAPAEVAQRVSSLQRWARQEVERRHGIVDKFAGDAIMATFNVAGQSVDHASQALRAALSIIDKASLAALPVGAGVAVGPAVVGSLAESANLSVLGEVTNLASRLQARAEAGEVLVAEEVHRRAKEWLDSQGIPAERVELQLKGFSSPVVAYRVRSEVAVATPA